jgi:5-methylcytosine-specific restriction endonuclease McrA
MTRLPVATKTSIELALAMGVSGRQVARAFSVSRTVVLGYSPGFAEKRKEWKSADHARNKKARNAVSRAYYAANAEEQRRKARSRSLHWAKENPVKHRLKGSRRRALERGAPVPCSKIEKLMVKYRYEDARQLTKETEIKHEVDHIWPLSKGGPHLPWNLRVITKDENLSKGAKI